MAFNRPNKEEGRAHTSTTVKMWQQFIHSEMRYIQNTWKASMAMQSSRWFPLTCWIRSDVPGEFPALNFSVSSWTKITQRKRLNVSHHTDKVVHQKAQKTKIKRLVLRLVFIESCALAVFSSPLCPFMKRPDGPGFTKHLSLCEAAVEQRRHVERWKKDKYKHSSNPAE